MNIPTESCPFCGECDGEIVIFVRRQRETEGVPTVAECIGCGARGPEVFESDDRNFLNALDAWNYREKKKVKKKKVKKKKVKKKK
tara:strand:- start:64 stop:318 length:255 start_codon:yes stop_codon:yes gene_type:complete